MRNSIKIINLPVLELDINNILLISITFLQTFDSTKFSSYLETSWEQSFSDIFLQAYERMREIIENYSHEPQLQNEFTALNPIELYYVYVILLGYLKEFTASEFLYYLDSKWKHQFRKDFWDIYYFLVSVPQESHTIVVHEKKIVNFQPIHHYHILLILLDCLITGGDPEIQPFDNKEFLNYLNANFDNTTSKAFIKSYYNLRQKIQQYYSKKIDSNDPDVDDMDFILRM